MCPGFLESCCWVPGHELGGLVKHFELYRSAHPEGRMTALTVVEDLQVVEPTRSGLSIASG